MKQYFIHCPGMAYAATAYGANRRDCLARYRKQWGLNRMPRGFSIWGKK